MKPLSLISMLAILACLPVGNAEALEDPFAFFSQEAKIISVTGRPQSRSESPLAIDVITAEDIRLSGAVNLWDLLRYRAGLDVFDIQAADGNRAMVSVRGFGEEFVNSLLVLVDGVSVHSATSGGVMWRQLPVQLQDIERIEVVHGPNAALFGSNAALGVINIITRRPSSSKLLKAEASGGSEKLRMAALSGEKAGESLGGRLSGGYMSTDGRPGTGRRPITDYLNERKASFRGFWKPAGPTDLQVMASIAGIEQGIATSRGPAGADDDWRSARTLLTQKTGEDSQLELSLAYQDFRYSLDPSPGLVDVKERLIQQDAQAAHRSTHWDGELEVNFGAGLRFNEAASTHLFENKAPASSRLLRGYINQHWRPTEKLSLTTAASLEDSDLHGLQPAVLAAVLVTPWEGQSFRAVHSRASSVQPLFHKHASFRPNSAVTLRGNPDLGAERMANYEVGYRSRLLGGDLRLESSFFYMELRDRMASLVLSRTFFPVFNQVITFDSRGRSLARGVESKIDYRLGPRFSVYTNHTYQRITDSLRSRAVSEGTPRNKVNLGGLTVLGRWTLSANAGWKSRYFFTSDSRSLSTSVAPDWRLDLRAGFRPRPDLEVFAAGRNVTRPGRVEAPDSLEIPAAVQGGLSWSFGGAQ